MENEKLNRQLWLLVLICGVLAVITYLLHDVIGGLHYPGYEWTKQAVSDLTAADAPSYVVASGFTTVHKILTCVCYAYLCILIKGERRVLRIGITLFAIMHGISAVGYALFPLTGSGYDGTTQSFIHVYVLTALIVPLSIISLILIAIGSFKGKHRLLGILALVALAAMFVGAVGSQAASKQYFGILERFSTYSATVFTGVLAVYGFARMRKKG